MKTLAKVGLILAAAGAVLATTGNAQVRGIVGAGLSAPVGDFADENIGGAEAGGVNALVGAEWLPMGRSFGVRLDGTYARFCTTACDADGADLDVHYRVLNANVSGLVELPIGMYSRVRPYVLAGAGIYNYELAGDDAPDGEDQTDFGLSGGLGLNVAVGRVAVFAEGRFHNVFGDETDLQYIPVTVGARIGLR